MRKNPDMRVGMTLPQFGTDAEACLRVAVQAEAAGLDGVFVFNHLWKIGEPGGNAIEGLTLLGALAQETTTIGVGTLVARVGLVPDAVLVHELVSLSRMVGDRLVAGIGTGDHISAAENLAFGIDYPRAAERLTAVEVVCRELRAAGIETWVGGRSAAIRRVAAAADALNVWDATAEEVRAEGGDMPRVTWGGQVDLSELDGGALIAHLRAIEAAGADFAVCAPINVGWADAVKTLSRARDLVH